MLMSLHLLINKCTMSLCLWSAAWCLCLFLGTTLPMIFCTRWVFSIVLNNLKIIFFFVLYYMVDELNLLEALRYDEVRHKKCRPICLKNYTRIVSWGCPVLLGIASCVHNVALKYTVNYFVLCTQMNHYVDYFMLIFELINLTYCLC